MNKKHKLLNILRFEDALRIEKKTNRQGIILDAFVFNCKGCKKEITINKYYVLRSTGYCRYCFTQRKNISDESHIKENGHELNHKQKSICAGCGVSYSVGPRVKHCSKCRYLIKKYGITLRDYNYMFAKQRGVCSICKKQETSIRHKNNLGQLYVDHCHKTGQVRGLLCSRCNFGIGSLQDNEAFLWAAIIYLKKHKSI